MRKKYYVKESRTNAKCIRCYSMKINRRILTNSVKEAIRKRDADIIFQKCTGEKFKHNIGIIDLGARDAFKTKGVALSIIKCAHDFNQHRVRDVMINNKLTSVECLRCNEVETWDHVITCELVRPIERDFIRSVTKELLQVNKG